MLDRDNEMSAAEGMNPLSYLLIDARQSLLSGGCEMKSVFLSNYGLK